MNEETDIVFGPWDDFDTDGYWDSVRTRQDNIQPSSGWVGIYQRDIICLYNPDKFDMRDIRWIPLLWGPWGRTERDRNDDYNHDRGHYNDYNLRRGIHIDSQ